MKKLTDHVYVVTGLRGCNVGLVITASGIVMIDTPWKPTEVVQLKKELAGKGEIKYIINTEPHQDHFTGNYFFDAPVVAHEDTRKVMSNFPLQAVVDRANELDPEGRPLMQGYRTKLPEITLRDRMAIHLGEVTVEVFHCPGHTASEVAVFIPEEKVLFATDNVSYRSKTWMQDAVPEDWVRSLRKLNELDVDKIVSGHSSDVCSKEYLRQQETVVTDWVKAVRSAIQSGLNEEQALSFVGNPDPFSLPKEREAMTPVLNKMIVTRLYQIYKK
ncbi:MAG: MBL fold metallo-hydrolase [Chloroflexi bacterium]|nr:MBL fold metallo-hydrolase [Chloroflexota bacterium]